MSTLEEPPPASFSGNRMIKGKMVPVVKSVEEFKVASSMYAPTDFCVEADTQAVASNHPVIEAVVARWKARSTPKSRLEEADKHGDNNKIAVAIEGGGMRGCVSAGATAALHYLGLTDSVDVVYGSSAGSMIGAYFCTRQPEGMGIYYKTLPKAGSDFIGKL